MEKQGKLPTPGSKADIAAFMSVFEELNASQVRHSQPLSAAHPSCDDLWRLCLPVQRFPTPPGAVVSPCICKANLNLQSRIL